MRRRCEGFRMCRGRAELACCWTHAAGACGMLCNLPRSKTSAGVSCSTLNDVRVGSSGQTSGCIEVIAALAGSMPMCSRPCLCANLLSPQCSCTVGDCARRRASRAVHSWCFPCNEVWPVMPAADIPTNTVLPALPLHKVIITFHTYTHTPLSLSFSISVSLLLSRSLSYTTT